MQPSPALQGRLVCPSCGVTSVAEAAGVEPPPPAGWNARTEWVSAALFLAAIYSGTVVWEWIRSGRRFLWAGILATIVVVAMFGLSCTGGWRRQIASALAAALALMVAEWLWRLGA